MTDCFARGGLFFCADWGSVRLIVVRWVHMSDQKVRKRGMKVIKIYICLYAMCRKSSTFAVETIDMAKRYTSLVRHFFTKKPSKFLCMWKESRIFATSYRMAGRVHRQSVGIFSGESGKFTIWEIDETDWTTGRKPLCFMFFSGITRAFPSKKRRCVCAFSLRETARGTCFRLFVLQEKE